MEGASNGAFLPWKKQGHQIKLRATKGKRTLVMQLGKQAWISRAIIKIQFKDQEPGPGKTSSETLKHGTIVSVNNQQDGSNDIRTY
uniref:Expressed protein n=3 Tax=Oryza TaxID=4527 RepID=Q10SF3_ORYSJ|nr:expressed protein [Oryza sativa Japonica Group]